MTRRDGLDEDPRSDGNNKLPLSSSDDRLLGVANKSSLALTVLHTWREEARD